MANHPLTLLETARFSEGVPELKLYISGQKKQKSLVEVDGDLKLTALKARRDAAIGQLSDDKVKTPWEKNPAASANFLAAVYRDSKYSLAGRRYMQHLGFASMLRGFYEGAKLAVEHEIK